MSNLNDTGNLNNEPTEAEIDFFISEMVSFVEARAAAVSEQDAIDAFLQHWRSVIQVRPEADVIEIREAS